MRIAQVATSSGPVREDQTGSIEAMIWLLARELTTLGHDVTIFGCRGSEPPCGFVETHPGPYGRPGTPGDWQLCDWMTLCAAVEQSSEFDVIHSHAYLWGLPLEQFSRAPMMHTLHTFPYHDERLLLERFPQARVTALSRAQWAGTGSRPPAAVIHHGVDPDRFTFTAKHAGYLFYLGRFIPGKGPLHAIAAARQAGMPIILAGPENEYYRTHVAPLVDGRQVRWVGPVAARERDALLGGAAALLYPLSEPEPFGLVQIEAMMCGTPVVATSIGASPEVIDPGVTGLLARSPDDLPTQVHAALSLDRARVRHAAIARYSARRMAEGYAALAERVIA